MHTFDVESHAALPQRHTPVLQVNPWEHGSLAPHLQVPDSQVSVRSEQYGLLPHLQVPELQVSLDMEHSGFTPHMQVLDVQVSAVPVQWLSCSHPI